MNLTPTQIAIIGPLFTLIFGGLLWRWQRTQKLAEGAVQRDKDCKDCEAHTFPEIMAIVIKETVELAVKPLIDKVEGVEEWLKTLDERVYDHTSRGPGALTEFDRKQLKRDVFSRCMTGKPCCNVENKICVPKWGDPICLACFEGYIVSKGGSENAV